METTAPLKRPPRNEIRSFLEAKPMSNQSLDAFTFRTCVYFWPWRFNHSQQLRDPTFGGSPRTARPTFGAARWGHRALPERPAAQGAATGLWLFQSIESVSPVSSAGTLYHIFSALSSIHKLPMSSFTSANAPQLAGILQCLDMVVNAIFRHIHFTSHLRH